MEDLRPIFWFQGLFLQPQHFQVWQRQNEVRLGETLAASRPHAWGILQLEINTDALLSSQLVLARCKAILPDGTRIDYPDCAECAPRLIDRNALSAEQPTSVYVGVRLWDEHGGNVTIVPDNAPCDAVQTRYMAHQDPEPQVDLLMPRAPMGNVHRMRPVMKIFLEQDAVQMSGYTTLEIARLVRKGEQLHLVETFVPPLVRLGAGSAICGLVRDIRDIVIFRATQLQEYKLHGEQRTKDFDPAYIIFLLALQTINRYVQILMHLAETDDVSPWEAYGVLRQFIGELSVFSRDLAPTGETADGRRVLLPYNHRDLYPCFLNARDLIQQLIAKLGTSIEFLVRLEPRDLLLHAELPERIFRPCNQYWLIVQADPEEDGEKLVEEVLRSAKLCAPFKMSDILVRAIPGIGLTHHHMPPSGLPKRAGSYYFLVDRQSPYWLEVEESREICLFWESRPENVNVFLAVVRSD